VSSLLRISPASPNRFHALRFAVKSDTIAVSTNRTVVFTERGKYDLPAAPLRVYSPDSTWM
jgi:hypothetical protein